MLEFGSSPKPSHLIVEFIWGHILEVMVLIHSSHYVSRNGDKNNNFPTELALFFPVKSDTHHTSSDLPHSTVRLTFIRERAKSIA